MTLRIGLIALAFSLAGCAHQAGSENAQPDPPSGQRGEEVRNLCFTRFLSGFDVEGDDRVIVRKGRREYELQMIGTCPELRFAQHLGIDSMGSCLSRGDRILAYPFGVSRQDWRPPSCIIGSIHEWLPVDAENPSAAADSPTPQASPD